MFCMPRRNHLGSPTTGLPSNLRFWVKPTSTRSWFNHWFPCWLIRMVIVCFSKKTGSPRHVNKFILQTLLRVNVMSPWLTQDIVSKSGCLAFHVLVWICAFWTVSCDKSCVLSKDLLGLSQLHFHGNNLLHLFKDLLKKSRFEWYSSSWGTDNTYYICKQTCLNQCKHMSQPRSHVYTGLGHDLVPCFDKLLLSVLDKALSSNGSWKTATVRYESCIKQPYCPAKYFNGPLPKILLLPIHDPSKNASFS